MKSRIALMSFFFCASLLRATVYSCDPPPGTPLCQFPKQVDIAFIGTAIDTNYDPNPPGGGDLAFFGMWYKFRVEEPLSGLRQGEKEVVAWMSLGGGQPEIGRKSFVSARREGDRRIRLTSCGSTKPAEEAGDDIDYLREKLAGNFSPYIRGSVLRQYTGSQYGVEWSLDGESRGLGRARVRLRGSAGAV